MLPKSQDDNESSVKEKTKISIGPQCSENGINNPINDMCMSVVARHVYLINLV